MSFWKEPENHKSPLKMVFYGPPKTGKTATALICAERLAARRKGKPAVIDTENGVKTYTFDNPLRTFHPKKFDIVVANTRSLEAITEALEGIDSAKYPCVVIDSISHLWDAAFDAWEAKNPGRKPELRDWGTLKRPYRRIMKWLVSTPCDVIVCGRQKNLFAEDSDGKLRNVGVGMRSEGESAYEPDTIFRFERDLRGEETIMTCEGDRWSVFTGKQYRDPTAAILDPILPLIGDSPPEVEDEDERAARDSQMLDEESDKAKAKTEKSSSILADMQAKLIAANDLPTLKAVADEIKKLKRYVIDEHRDVLLMLYEERRKVLVNATVPEGV